ncbi:thioredoxin family protein [Hymenobacter weizhouensis]|uniref:thioredoxin family protein n=1 Tax=Hymenobacter sp. YIM 151500-1 TaxID=2987689 RepID=UPI002225C4F9|nr:thioredoxin family protein [Hymenobacter sp. YIM 151500-1]UYZ64399.1 thioredoxin family protein [Hymenobacter sp. YIM 151500-1]
MSVIDTNDIGLRTLIHDYPKVVAKFTSENCAICELLAPSFEKYSLDPRYSGIAFLRLNSDENPVARQMMAQRVAPFFVAYHRGRMLECDTLQHEQEVTDLLERLLDYRSVGAN